MKIGVLGTLIDVGGLESSRYLEALSVRWVISAFSTDPPDWNHAFKMLSK